MAGDWIPMRLDLPEDPAVLEMADILGQPEEYVVGCLHKIWSWASRQCHDGTVTGVTVVSLSRAVKLPDVVTAMVRVGWLIDGRTEDDRPFIAFPKWENWLSKSAKARLNNAINQRNSRANKGLAEKPDPKKPVEAVTNVSPNGSDKPVTTEEKSTGEEFNLSVCADDPNGLIGRDVICPDWMREWFIRWLDWRWQDSGKKPPATLQQTWIMELSSRGQEKAIVDLQFSISKQAKNLLRSENDLDKVTKARIESATRPMGKETGAEAFKRIFGGQ